MKAPMRQNQQLAWVAVILVIAAAIFAYLYKAPALTWDDDSNIFNNPYYLNHMWANFWSEPYFGLFVPVTSTVWEVLFRLGGGSPVIFRIFNLLLHVVNSALVFLLLRGLARRWNLPAVAVLIGLAIFALHPMQVHAVAWISGGRDLMAAFFALACLCVYFSERRKGATDHSRFALATALFLTSMLCKPSTAILPAVVIGLEAMLEAHVAKVTIIRLTLWTFFASAVAWLTKLAQQDFVETSLSFGQRLLLILDSYSFYLQKFVAPYPLTANYGRTPDVALADGTLYASVFMALAVLIGFAFLSWKRDRHYLLILVWFTALLPVSGVVTFGYQIISTVSDHYNYLPMALLAAFTAVVLSRIDWEKLPRALPAAVLIIVISVLATLSFNRVHAWENDVAFFTDMSRNSPDSYSTALGMSIVMCEDQKQYEEGVKWTEVALKVKPLDILAMANQAYCFLHAKNYFRVIELEYYLGQLDLEEMEQKQPTAYSSLLSSIGTAYIEQQELEDGFQFLCEAVRVKPSEPGHVANLEVAKNLLKSKGIEPTCEQVNATDDEEQDREPIEEVWPQIDEGTEGE